MSYGGCFFLVNNLKGIAKLKKLCYTFYVSIRGEETKIKTKRGD